MGRLSEQDLRLSDELVLPIVVITLDVRILGINQHIRSYGRVLLSVPTPIQPLLERVARIVSRDFRVERDDYH